LINFWTNQTKTNWGVMVAVVAVVGVTFDSLASYQAREIAD